MPKVEIDYSNTIIYKITCKNSNITDVYVGHTTNFVQRKHAHKQSCINNKSHNYKCKLYETIRNNGGWDNWNMEIINFFNCNDHYEARKKEQEYFVSLNATLNSIEPMPKPKFKPIQNQENIEKDHSMVIANKKPLIFVCKQCNFNTCNRKDYNRHIQTKKHLTIFSQCLAIKKTHYECLCGKKYVDNSGLWRHKQKCNIEFSENNKDSNNSENPDKKDELINYLIKENQEFKNLILEIVKKDTTTNNNITTNSHNKTFNLQFFLNETCKDAMNIMDFVDSIKLQLSDLEKVGKIGYVEGISSIIVKNLNSLDENKRPVHCTDSKREVMYIKDENKWEKENETKVKLRTVIKHVAHKNSKALKDFRTKHPDCDKSTSKYSDQYNKLVIEAMGGKGDNDLEKEDKIIKNIAKNVVIDKNSDIN